MMKFWKTHQNASFHAKRLPLTESTRKMLYKHWSKLFLAHIFDNCSIILWLQIQIESSTNRKNSSKCFISTETVITGRIYKKIPT